MTPFLKLLRKCVWVRVFKVNRRHVATGEITPLAAATSIRVALAVNPSALAKEAIIDAVWCRDVLKTLRYLADLDV